MGRIDELVLRDASVAVSIEPLETLGDCLGVTAAYADQRSEPSSPTIDVAGHAGAAELSGGEIPVAVRVRHLECRHLCGAQLLLVERTVAVQVDRRSSGRL